TQVAVNMQLNQFNYQILDAQGKIVLNGQANQNPFTLYSENLSNGIYWLKILNVPEFTPHKLIVN
ncbi:MAG: T9SS type A sorting domain-containing protein, partial [Bacteroidota bacterium]|nr:T9SS type A sorting domain-containing protein [Bacteroidota bacterium]